MTDPDKKSYSIEFEHHDPYLHATVRGHKVTRQIALDYWREIIDQCESKNCSKILLEHDFAEMISMPEMLEVIGPVTDMLQGRMLAFYDCHGNYDIPEAGKKNPPQPRRKDADLRGPGTRRTLAAGELISRHLQSSKVHHNPVN